MKNNKGKIIFSSISIGGLDDYGMSFTSPAFYNHIISSDIVAVENLSLFNAMCEKANIQLKAMAIQYNHLSENDKETRYLLDEAKNGKTIVMVSDGGTSALYDPGLYLLNLAIKESIDIIVLPGPNSVIPAILMSGFFLSKGFTSLGWVFHFLEENQSLHSLDNWFKDIFKNNPLPISMLYTSDVENIIPQSNVEKIKRGMIFLKNNIDKNKKVFFVSNMSTPQEFQFRGSFEEFLVVSKMSPQNFVNGVLVLDSK